MSNYQRLAELKAERAAIDAEIALIEKGIARAAYDFSMKEQLVTLNEVRVAGGKPTLSGSQFASGLFGDPHDQ